MSRFKSKIIKAPWYAEWERLSAKYAQKWVMGDEGVFWVNTVYHGIGGFQVTLFRSKKYGECKLVSLTEFEQKFKVVEVILEQIKA